MWWMRGKTSLFDAGVSSVQVEGSRLHLDWPQEELLREAMRGDAAAFAELCERARHRVWRIVRSLAGARDPDDLAQEVVVRAWCARGSYRADAPFEAWLCRIAVNVARDDRRSAWSRRVIEWTQPLDAAGAPEPVADALAAREVQRRVRQAIASLPERQRNPVWLHFIEGYTMAEIARLERTAETTIRSRVQAGRGRLRVLLCDVVCEGTDAVDRVAAPSKGQEA